MVLFFSEPCYSFSKLYCSTADPVAECYDVVIIFGWCWIHFQINSTENRSVLHVALRASRDAVIQSDGKNVVPEVWNVLDKIKDFSERVRNGSWVICYSCVAVFYVDVDGCLLNT